MGHPFYERNPMLIPRKRIPLIFFFGRASHPIQFDKWHELHPEFDIEDGLPKNFTQVSP